jgi:hypothetical protein
MARRRGTAAGTGGPVYGSKRPTPKRLAETLSRRCAEHLRANYNYWKGSYDDRNEAFDVLDAEPDDPRGRFHKRPSIEGSYSFLIRAWRGGALLWTADVTVTPELDVIVDEEAHSRSYKPPPGILACLSASYEKAMR